MPEVLKNIYVALWTHEQGQEISVHTTKDGAYEQCIAWANESLNKKEDVGQQINEFVNYTNSELCANWCEITNYTEFLRVDITKLHYDSLEDIEDESEKD
jgi:hypothetical protein